MNPDTKLTVEQLKTICEAHGITYKSHGRITAGFSQEVHRLNDDLVIKLYNTTDDPSRFKTEAALLGSELPFLKPKLIAADDGEEIGRSYVIMSYIPGVSLGGVWHTATNEQRERLIRQIAETLQVINEIDPKLIGADTTKTWQETMTNNCLRDLDKLATKKGLDELTIQKTKEAISRYAPSLADSEQYVVFWDIHSDNFIVNEDFELQAIIDLEGASYAALDFPLFVIQKMTDMPHKYLREEEEKFADRKDYLHLKDWYRKYYPEMFNFNALDSRLRMYQLGDVLQLLQDWPDNKDNRDDLARLIG